MPAVDPLAIRQKTESALYAYLASRIAAATGNALVSPRVVTISKRAEVTTKVLPRLVLQAADASTVEEAQQIYRVTFVAYLGASAFESRDAGGTASDILALHAARVGLVTEWLADEAAILTYCNAPTSGTDTRTVKGLRIYQMHPDDETGDQVDNHFMEQLTYTVIAQLQDEAD